MSNLSSNGLSRVLSYIKSWVSGLLSNKPTIRTDILHFACVSSLDANAILEDDIWYVYGGITGAPMSNHGVLVYVKSVGPPISNVFS